MEQSFINPMRDKEQSKTSKKSIDPECELRVCNFMFDFGVKCDGLENILRMMYERIDPANVVVGKRFAPENRVPGRLVRDELCVGFHRLVHLVCNIDFEAMLDFMGHKENGHDCIVNTFKGLLHGFDRIISDYRFYTSNIELYLGCQSAFYRLLPALLKIAKQEAEPDSNKIREYGARLLHAIRRLADDVYRDEPVPPLEFVLTDEPMTLPAPDAGEMDARLPSRREMMGAIKDWHIEEVDRSLSRMNFMSLDKSHHRVFANECIQRLMGYSYRIWRDTTMTPRQKAQIPRFAPYPFYFRFFDFAGGIINAADAYRNKEMPYRGANLVKNPIQGFPLAHRMKDVLMFAPREYFEHGRTHWQYMLLVKNVYIASMTYLRRSLPLEIRLHAAPFMDKAEVAFVDFLTMVNTPVSGTVREYAAKCDRMRYSFLDALRGMASIMECYEDELSPDGSNPYEEEKRRSCGEYYERGDNSENGISNRALDIYTQSLPWVEELKGLKENMNTVIAMLSGKEKKKSNVRGKGTFEISGPLPLHKSIIVEPGVFVKVNITKYTFSGSAQWDIIGKFLRSLSNGENHSAGNFPVPFTSADYNKCKRGSRALIDAFVERQPVAHRIRNKQYEDYARFIIEKLK